MSKTQQKVTGVTPKPSAEPRQTITPAPASTDRPEANAQCPVSDNVRGHENIEWSIAYAYGLTDASKNLPRALLVGDSICNAYQARVRELLAGKVNVSYWVSSYCVTSPNYRTLLEVQLDEACYDVVHFNNGLHSLKTPVEAYARGYGAALRLIRERQPGARIVWCSSTPLKDAERTAKTRALNAAAAEAAARLGGVGFDDLFSLLDPLDREENWCDAYHHREVAREMEAQQVSGAVLAALHPDRDAPGTPRSASGPAKQG